MRQDGIGGKSLCDIGENIQGSKRGLIRIFRIRLKQNYCIRGEFRDPQKQSGACRSKQVDFPDFVLVTKQFGVLG